MPIAIEFPIPGQGLFAGVSKTRARRVASTYPLAKASENTTVHGNTVAGPGQYQYKPGSPLYCAVLLVRGRKGDRKAKHSIVTVETAIPIGNPVKSGGEHVLQAFVVLAAFEHD